MSRIIAATALFAILLAALPGCGGNTFTYPEPSLDKKDGAFVSRPGSVKIGSAEYAADFGTILVPENRSNTNSRLIDLPVIRIRSRSEHPSEPIFCFYGGPGQKNMSWDWNSTEFLIPEHDIVLVGYRGVDGSTVLDCPEVAEAVKLDDPLSEHSLKTIAAAWQAGAHRLTSQGIDLDGYTMLDVIEDHEAVRKALGYQRINLLSESYGTRIAYLYALKHPESIKRSIMISVNPPGHFVWDPKTIDNQLRYYSDLWSKDSLMCLKSKDLYGDMKAILDSMPRKWFLFSIDPAKVKIVTFALLFRRTTAAMVFDTYEAAKQGDPSGLALMSLAYDYTVPSMCTWGDLASKAVSADFDSTRDYFHEMEPPGLPLGSPMSKLALGTSRYFRWPTQQLPEEFRQLKDSDVETLLLSGSIDFSTPPEFATNELLPHLKKGTQVILSECGHVSDVIYLNPENTRRMISSYYRTGEPDTSLNVHKPMNFQVSWGFPKIAKTAAETLAVLGTAAIVGLVLLARHILQ
jgi:pimeloyl-ACP methyl ester carboxylesterase